MHRTISETAPRTKHLRLARLLREQIITGELAPGDRLPSFAEFRAQHGAAISTVEKVLTALEREGLIERRQGSGTFVSERKHSLTGNIGFIGGAVYFDKERGPFNRLLVEGVQQAIEERQQHLLYLGNKTSLQQNAAAKVDGVLLGGVADPAGVLALLPADLPRVSMLHNVEGAASVVADDYGGARLAVRHLLELGHRRIACLMEERPLVARQRFYGYHDALLEAGIAANPRWIRRTGPKTKIKETAQPYLEWARRHMRDWLKNGWKKTRCTAILAQNEVAAIGVMQILQEAKIQVPQDVSVIGFDGTEICDLVSPRLCAMQLPLAQIGTKAVEMLNRQIAGEDAEAQTIVLPLRWREGESVAPPRQ